MPRETISVPVVRPGDALTPDGMSGYIQGDPVAVTGSPFQCRLFRKSQFTVNRKEEPGAVITTDDAQVLLFLNPAAPIEINDVATLPDGTSATIQRLRKYQRHLQCDIRTGDIPDGS